MTHPVVLRILASIFFTSIFLISYAFFNADLFQYRDDGVITMSAGKHLVDFGFIGVSPSGPRAEVSSSPLQTFVYASFYALFDLGYAEFSWLQTLLATLLLGAMLLCFFPLSKKGMIAYALIAVGLTLFYPFFFWHASGMENALTHVLFLMTIYLIYHFDQRQKIFYPAAVVVFLATICRVDSIIHIAPLLIVYSVYSYKKYRRLDAFIFSFFVFILWSTFHFWRYSYFGDILPNTAYAQGISAVDNLYKLLTLDGDQWSIGKKFSGKVFIKQGGWLLLLLIPLYKQIIHVARQRNTLFLLGLLLLLIVTGSLVPYLFGKARIDINRTSTQITPLILLFFAISVIHLPLDTLKRWGKFALPIAMVAYATLAVKPYYLGWSTKGFENVRGVFTQLADEHNIPRPLISNPDLGAMTWHKQFNVVDLGLLGSPVMAHLDSDDVGSYYLDFALPDLIEAHTPWLNRLCGSIFATDKFDELYKAVNSDKDVSKACKGDESFGGIWIRKDIMKSSSSFERLFLNDLQESLSVDRIEMELKYCKKHEVSCHYVVKSVYRFIPELVESGQYDNVLQLFVLPKEIALLTSFKNAQFYKAFLKAAE